MPLANAKLGGETGWIGELQQPVQWFLAGMNCVDTMVGSQECPACPFVNFICQLTAEYTADNRTHTTIRSAVKHLTSRNLDERPGFVCQTYSVRTRHGGRLKYGEERLMQKPALL